MAILAVAIEDVPLGALRETASSLASVGLRFQSDVCRMFWNERWKG